jgi:hypothetical protein
MEEFGVLKVRRQVIEQASDFEQLLARPGNIADLGARLGNTRLPGAEGANHCSAPRFINNGISWFVEHGNASDRRRERI